MQTLPKWKGGHTRIYNNLVQNCDTKVALNTVLLEKYLGLAQTKFKLSWTLFEFKKIIIKKLFSKYWKTLEMHE